MYLVELVGLSKRFLLMQSPNNGIATLYYATINSIYTTLISLLINHSIIKHYVILETEGVIEWSKTCRPK
jgi:hypothetical protein